MEGWHQVNGVQSFHRGTTRRRTKGRAPKRGPYCCIRRGYCALLFHTMFSAWYKQVQYQNANPTIASNYERIFAFSAANSSSVSTPLSRSAASLSSLAATSPLSTSVSIVCETCGYCSSSFDRASTISAIFFAFLPPFNTFALTLDDELTVTPDPPSTGTTEILIFSPQDQRLIPISAATVLVVGDALSTFTLGSFSIAAFKALNVSSGEYGT